MTGDVNGRIRLTGPEWWIAAVGGAMRHMESITSGRKDAHGYDGRDSWTKHIEGAAGELAAAKYYGLLWLPGVCVFRGPDLANDVQVRTRSEHGWDLPVRPNDSDDHVFVLVTGRSPEFVVRGWVRGADARRDEWIQTYGGRPPAHFVPQAALNTGPLP